MKFVEVYLADVITPTRALQKETGTILDIIGLFDTLKTKWHSLASGNINWEVKKTLDILPAAMARSCGAAFRNCGKTLVQKVDSIFTKTVKANSVKAAQCMVSLCPSSLQNDKLIPPTVMIKATIPLIDLTEWEKYITLPKQVPAPTSTTGRVAWWMHRIEQFPELAPFAVAYLSALQSAARSERTFSLLGHTQRIPFSIKCNLLSNNLTNLATT